MAAEVYAIGALGIAQAGSAGVVLRAIEHDEFIMKDDYGGIEGSGGFPGVALRRKDGSVGDALPMEDGRRRLGGKRSD